MKYTLLKNKTTGERRVRINETGEYVSELVDRARYNMLRKRAKRNRYRQLEPQLEPQPGPLHPPPLHPLPQLAQSWQS